MKTFGEIIKDFRKQLNLSQTEFAEKLGYDFRIVSCWENNKNKPNMDTIKAIHDIFNLDYDELFDYTNK